MWIYAATALAAVGAAKLYLKSTTGWCRIEKDMSDQVVLITGPTSGIGKSTAMELAKRGATVHLACRNLDAGRAVAEEIRNECRRGVGNGSGSGGAGNAAETKEGDGRAEKVRVWQLDLGRLKSVREFANQYLASGQPIHVLINNAGVGGYPEKIITEDKLELTMATNHFGPFLLTSLLMDRLKSSAPSRIINVASVVHRLPFTFPLDDVNFQTSLMYSGYWAYCRSKLANVMFTKELSRRVPNGVTVYSLHPGTVRTNLFKERPWYVKLWMYAARPFLKTPLEGAQTTLHLCTAPNIEHTNGGYYSDCAPASVNGLIENDQLVGEFFDLSTRLTGAKWDK